VRANRNALATTNNEDNDIPMPANNGDIQPQAASGIQTTL
jgi:hypothetical protein